MIDWQLVRDSVQFYLSPISVFHNAADPLLWMIGVFLAGFGAFAFPEAVGIPLLFASLVLLGVTAVYRLLHGELLQARSAALLPGGRDPGDEQRT